MRARHGIALGSRKTVCFTSNGRHVDIFTKDGILVCRVLRTTNDRVEQEQERMMPVLMN